MDYEFFQAMTADEAREFLDQFLALERLAIDETVTRAASEGVRFDFSLASLADALRWMVGQVRVYRTPAPAELPEWIRQAHAGGLAQYEEDSKTVLLRAAYYLGESFARLPGLRWTTGNPDLMECNMPVVAGFRSGQEVPPLVVVDSLFAGIASGENPPERIDATVKVWSDDCPR
jgi:hypothetical protein